MRVVITGGTGFIGQKLARRLLESGKLGGAEIDEIVLFDIGAPLVPIEDRRVRVMTGDIANAANVREAIAPGTASVFHLAAVVSAQAEAEFDTGMRVNLDGTRTVLEPAVRWEARRSSSSPPRSRLTVATFLTRSPMRRRSRRRPPMACRR